MLCFITFYRSTHWLCTAGAFPARGCAADRRSLAEGTAQLPGHVAAPSPAPALPPASHLFHFPPRYRNTAPAGGTGHPAHVPCLLLLLTHAGSDLAATVPTYSKPFPCPVKSKGRGPALGTDSPQKFRGIELPGGWNMTRGTVQYVQEEEAPRFLWLKGDNLAAEHSNGGLAKLPNSYLLATVPNEPVENPLNERACLICGGGGKSLPGVRLGDRNRVNLAESDHPRETWAQREEHSFRVSAVSATRSQISLPPTPQARQADVGNRCPTHKRAWGQTC